MGVVAMNCVLLAVAIAVPAVSASSAWSDFVAYSGPVAAPEGHVPALNLASTRRSAGMIAQTAVIQPSTATEAAYQTSITVNSFISQAAPGAENNRTHNKQRIFELCAKGAKGTSFYALVKEAYRSGKVDQMPPQCAYCLSQGYGTDESTPGFYLPCGCQNTCVDVSGYLKANWARLGLPEKDMTNSGAPTQGVSLANFTAKGSVFPQMARAVPLSPLEDCSGYLSNQIVYSCADIAQYHFVLWPSVLAVLAMAYTAYAMAYMQLDMDSLLYTVGGGKKDN